MAEPFDAQAFTSQLRAALAEAMPTAEFSEELDDDMAALTAMDPVPATLMAAIVIGDWVEAQQTAGGAALLALNPRLMTCSVGLLPINNDELAVVLCRRVPASSVLPGDVVGLVDDMIWEYAQVAGWVEQDGTDAAPPVRQSRLIGSLDEL
jgi:hypothetical protein